MRMNGIRLIMALVCLALGLIQAQAHAQSGPVALQGKLDGVDDGVRDFTLTIWNAATGGQPVATAEGTAMVRSGLFTLLVNLPVAAFDGASRWWSVAVDGQELPRQRVVYTPMALRAGNLHVRAGSPITTGLLSAFPPEGEIIEGEWGVYLVGSNDETRRLRLGVSNNGITKADITLTNNNDSFGRMAFSTSRSNGSPSEQRLGINEWEDVIRTRGFRPGAYPITFRVLDLGAGTLGRARTFWSSSSGDLIRCEIEFNARFAWFVDPTPATSDDLPADRFDLLTVTRHELGHAVGWLGGGNPRFARYVSGATFSASRLNVQLSGPGESHASEGGGELMQPAIGMGTRRFIALYPTVSVPSLAFENATRMEYADPGFTGTPDGSPARPWRGFTQAMTQGDGRFPLLLAPTRFFVSAGSTFATPREIVTARGGASIE